MTLSLRRVLLLALLGLVVPPPAAGDDGPRILRITPAGEDVPAGRQIVITFDRPMVALGDMSRERVPVRIRPRLDCRWRWLDTRALACELAPEKGLTPATRYEVDVDPGLPALDGSRLAAPVRHAFITARPRVEQARFHRWLAADRPALQVHFDQPVDRASVARHLFFEAPGKSPDRIPVRVAVSHADGEAVLAGSADPAQIAHAALLASSARRVWMLAPAAALPADARVALRVEPGVRGGGAERGVEDRVAAAFHTFAEFSFEGIRCTHIESRDTVVLDPTAATPGPGPCDPLAGIALLFSSPVHDADVARALSMSPPLPGSGEERGPWDRVRRRASLRQIHGEDTTYAVWLPVQLGAHRGHRLQLEAGALHDAFGRPLRAGVDMRFGTSHRRARLHAPHPVAVLEQGVDSEVPLYVTNLDAIDLTWHGSGSPVTGLIRSPLPEVEDLAYAVPLPVRRMLGGRSGAVSGQLAPVPQDAESDNRHFFAQVTPFAVTVKLGHFSSIAWITRMDDGSPVSGAALTLHQDTYRDLAGPGPGAVGPFVTDSKGIARLPGSAVLDPSLALLENWRRDEPRLFLRVDHGADMAVLPLDNDFRIWTRDVWPQRRAAFGHLKAWGTTSQGIYRAGERIDYKLYLRHQDIRALVPAPRTGYRLTVVDPRGEALVDGYALTLNEFGAAAGEVQLPAGAAVGWYRFRVTSGHGPHDLEAFRVLVSDFTPAPFKVQSTLNGTAFEPGDRLRVDTRASLHAGGPYASAATRVTVRLAARPFVPEHPLARRFRFDTAEPGEARTLHQDQAPLDADGARSVEVQLDDPGIRYGRILVESAVSDDRGKRVSGQAAAQFAARDRFVGLRSTSWLHTVDEPARVEYLVVDAAGEPAAGTPVALTVERETIFTARVKGAGNSYQPRHERLWVDAGQCTGTSGTAAAQCEFVPRHPGRYRVTARIVDTHDRAHESVSHTWVQGRGQVTWAEPEDGALDLVPESTRPKVGDIARYLVRNPFPGALALVTVERYGVLRSWTERLEGSTPVIAFPVTRDDVPGFHLSVTVLSPRVAAPPLRRGEVDLGKPAMRMGYVTVPVDDPVKRLAVTVAPASPRYEPRQTARIDLTVSTGDAGARPVGPVELAVAVLDEAVFDLLAAGSRSFDPYAGFYDLGPPDVVSYGLLTRLVGRQKFEKKGADAGGDGGPSRGLRDIDRFVSYWNPSLPVDGSGRARIEFALPDNLTRWRVLALAVTPGDRMGLGEGGFAVSKDTELRPVMPNQVRPGDRFRAGFTVLNRTPDTRTLRVSLQASGDAAAQPAETLRDVTVAPFGREPVWLAVEAARPGTLSFTARAGDDRDGDALAHAVPVIPAGAAQTAASHGSLDEGTVETPFQIPGDLLPGSGRVSVTASQTVLGDLDGAFRHMRDYPYACWEQRLSKAVMASRHRQLQDRLAADLAWPGSTGLPQETLDQAARFQAPNGGMAYWVPEDARVSPYLSAYTALAFTWLETAGFHPPERVRDRLDDYLATLLRRQTMPDFYTRGMASSVRAVALAALARRGRLRADDALRYLDALPRMSVFASALYLEALWRTLGAHPAVDRVRDALLAHASESAGTLSFSETVIDSDGKHLLDTPARANCAVLDSLAALATDPSQAATLTPLLAKLVRTVSAARGRRDHWENTQENVFCMGALAHYASAFEATEPAFTLHAQLNGTPLGGARFTSRTDPPVVLERALDDADAGTRQTLGLRHEGHGRAYFAARLHYETDAQAATRVDAGMSLRREYSVMRDGRWVLLSAPFTVRRGELLRVDLYLWLPTARHFVVVDDPVPGALEPVNRDLATASTVDADEAANTLAGGAWWHTRDDWRGFASQHWSFYHRELSHRAARFFSDYLPAGHYHLGYTAQVVASGTFHVPAPHAEAMYDPEIFANGLPGRLVVSDGETP